MAFPVVANQANGNDTTGTSHTVTVPGVAAGDLIIVLLASDGAPTYTWPNPKWDQAANNLFSIANGTAVKMEGKQRIADGSEGGSFVVTTSVSEFTAFITLKITGWHGTTVAEAATATATKLDPPSLNPAGWDVEDTLWISCGAVDAGGADNDDITAHSASYTGIAINLAVLDAGGVSQAASWRNNAVAAENPGAMTSPTAEESVNATIAIRPSGLVVVIPELVMPPYRRT